LQRAAGILRVWTEYVLVELGAGVTVHAVDHVLLEVRYAPAESQSKWDLLKIATTLPGEEAFRPEREDNCKLVN
jgi:hypothetical protein